MSGRKKGGASPIRGAFGELLRDQLRDPKFAAAYLNEHVSYEGSDSRALLLQAMKNVAEARGMARTAEEASIPRRTLYHALSADGNPTLDTLRQFLSVTGIQLSFKAVATHHSSRPDRTGRTLAKTKKPVR